MGMHKHLCTPENVVYAMHEYYRAGHSIRNTGIAFGIAPKTVFKVFKRHGLHIRSRAHALLLYNNLDGETRAMHKDHMSGMTYAQVAEKYHYSQHTVYRRFHSRGLKGRVRGSRRAGA